MVEIINLNRARKAKAKAEKGKTAQANRVAHGTPKALRNLADARKEKDRAAHEAGKLDEASED